MSTNAQPKNEPNHNKRREGQLIFFQDQAMTSVPPLQRNSKTLQNEVRNNFSFVSHGESIVAKHCIETTFDGFKIQYKAL